MESLTGKAAWMPTRTTNFAPTPMSKLLPAEGSKMARAGKVGHGDLCVINGCVLLFVAQKVLLSSAGSVQLLPTTLQVPIHKSRRLPLAAEDLCGPYHVSVQHCRYTSLYFVVCC